MLIGPRTKDSPVRQSGSADGMPLLGMKMMMLTNPAPGHVRRQQGKKKEKLREDRPCGEEEAKSVAAEDGR